MTSVLWFRNDLRLSDNPALRAALARGKPIVPIFILDDEDAGEWAPGGASRWWLHGSLASLSAELTQRRSRLVLRRGPAQSALDTLIKEVDADAVFWNRRYEPFATKRDAKIKAELSRRGLHVESFNGALLREPLTLGTNQGNPYRVFTPFRRALFDDLADVPHIYAPQIIPAPEERPASDELESWNLRPRNPDWAVGFRVLWKPGEGGAHQRLSAFLDEAVMDYPMRRDFPGIPGTSSFATPSFRGNQSSYRIFISAKSSFRVDWFRYVELG